MKNMANRRIILDLSVLRTKRPKMLFHLPCDGTRPTVQSILDVLKTHLAKDVKGCELELYIGEAHLPSWESSAIFQNEEVVKVVKVENSFESHTSQSPISKVEVVLKESEKDSSSSDTCSDEEESQLKDLSKVNKKAENNSSSSSSDSELITPNRKRKIMKNDNNSASSDSDIDEPAAKKGYKSTSSSSSSDDNQPPPTPPPPPKEIKTQNEEIKKKKRKRKRKKNNRNRNKIHNDAQSQNNSQTEKLASNEIQIPEPPGIVENKNTNSHLSTSVPSKQQPEKIDSVSLNMATPENDKKYEMSSRNVSCEEALLGLKSDQKSIRKPVASSNNGIATNPTLEHFFSSLLNGESPKTVIGKRPV